ncbi:MAG: hypothetical protein ABIT37_19315 [Luteolibacter sp.]
MKLPGLLLAIMTSAAFSQSSDFVNFIRQTQQGTGVVWDMPVAATGAAASALTLEPNGALFQLWTVQQSPAQDYLLDQKLVGAYLPTADIRIVTLDPDGVVPRTRVDQPFSVEINVTGLLSGSGLPLASTQVLLEQHIASYPSGQTTLNPTTVLSNAALYTGYLAANGKTVLKFPASSLKATDPTKALGEEHFVVHALSDGTISQTQIASGKVQVWPVASGQIKGIASGDLIRFQSPQIELILNDVYPRSDTSFMVYEGSSVNGITGTLVKAFPWTSDATTSTVIPTTELDSKFSKDGTYTVALMSTTVYGTELLCPPVTFQVKRTLQVNAMQVNLSDTK